MKFKNHKFMIIFMNYLIFFYNFNEKSTNNKTLKVENHENAHVQGK